jgi:hypothetical protein
LQKSSTINQQRHLIEALIAAINMNDIDLCESLIEEGLDINTRIRICDGCTPLLIALRSQKYEIAEWLLERGCIVAGAACDIDI